MWHSRVREAVCADNIFFFLTSGTQTMFPIWRPHETHSFKLQLEIQEERRISRSTKCRPSYPPAEVNESCIRVKQKLYHLMLNKTQDSPNSFPVYFFFLFIYKFLEKTRNLAGYGNVILFQVTSDCFLCITLSFFGMYFLA